MNNRRPVASPRSSALPTLVALLAAGVAVECYAADAYAQTPPAQDGGVASPQPVTPPEFPPVRPAGGIPPAHPHDPPLPPPPHHPAR